LKLSLNVTSYLVTAIAAVLASFSLAEIYHFNSDDEYRYYQIGIFLMSPITVIVSFIICYFLIKKITI